MPEIVSRKLRSTSPVQPKKQDEPIASLRLHITCIVVVLIAAGIFTLTEHDDHKHSLWCAFEIGMQVILVIVGTFYFRKRISMLGSSFAIAPMLVMIACLSLICEPIQRIFFDTGHAFEILVMHCQCNLMLALAACGFRISYQRLAIMIAVFMTIFCGTISNAIGLLPLIVLFAFAAITWLVVGWWETVDRRRLKSDRTRIPKLWLATAIALPVLAMAAAGGFGSNTMTTALEGFMPGSGGTGDYDPFSRGGVNDGDALIAGNEDIKSFAPLEDAPFVESDQPSLYDIFNDTYDEPAKKITDQQRAIALPPDLMKHIHQEMAEAKQAGREFSLVRSEKVATDERIRDLNTTALFYVAGRTPVHFKTQVYELFDGVGWMPTTAESVPNLKLEETEGRQWLSLSGNRSFDVFADSDTHSLKVANLDGNVIPIPTHTVGANIDKVDRADMYNVLDNGLVQLSRKSLPSMTPINLVSKCVDEDRLRNNDDILQVIRREVATRSDIFVVLPEGEDTIRIRSLAQQLIFGIPRGWGQVEAIRDYLRENMVLDRSARIDPDSISPVADFIFTKKRGPEYLFASAAAVMLRTLGYSTRLTGGFYARPEKYDARKKHTSVHAADAHFWSEVSIGASTWMTVEASPGYHELKPRPGLLARTLDAIYQAWLWVKSHAVAFIGLGIALVLLFVGRRHVQNALLTGVWRLFPSHSDERRAVRLAALIDQRLRLAGLERKQGTTLRRWSQRTELQPVQQDMHRVAEIVDEAMYNTKQKLRIDAEELKQLEQRLSYRQLKRLTQSTTQAA